MLWPFLRVQVAVHEVLGERKEPDDQIIANDTGHGKVFRKGPTHEFSGVSVSDWKPTGRSVILRRDVGGVTSKTDIETEGCEKPIRLANANRCLQSIYRRARARTARFKRLASGPRGHAGTKLETRGAFPRGRSS